MALDTALSSISVGQHDCPKCAKGQKEVCLIVLNMHVFSVLKIFKVYFKKELHLQIACY